MDNQEHQNQNNDRKDELTNVLFERYTSESFLNDSMLSNLDPEHDSIRGNIPIIDLHPLPRNTTGFLIDANHVATAFHTICPLSKSTISIEFPPIENFTIYFNAKGKINKDDKQNQRKVIKYYYPKELDNILFYKKQDINFDISCYDYALLELDRPVETYSSQTVKFDHTNSDGWEGELQNIMVYGYPRCYSKTKRMEMSHFNLIGQIGTAFFDRKINKINIIANTSAGTSGSPYIRIVQTQNTIQYLFLGIHLGSIMQKNVVKNIGLKINQEFYRQLKNQKKMSVKKRRQNVNSSSNQSQYPTQIYDQSLEDTALLFPDRKKEMKYKPEPLSIVQYENVGLYDDQIMRSKNRIQKQLDNIKKLQQLKELELKKKSEQDRQETIFIDSKKSTYFFASIVQSYQQKVERSQEFDKRKLRKLIKSLTKNIGQVKKVIQIIEAQSLIKENSEQIKLQYHQELVQQLYILLKKSTKLHEQQEVIFEQNRVCW